jgi:hypothetical protein
MPEDMSADRRDRVTAAGWDWYSSLRRSLRIPSTLIEQLRVPPPWNSASIVQYSESPSGWVTDLG